MRRDALERLAAMEGASAIAPHERARAARTWLGELRTWRHRERLARLSSRGVWVGLHMDWTVEDCRSAARNCAAWCRRWAGKHPR